MDGPLKPKEIKNAIDNKITELIQIIRKNIRSALGFDPWPKNSVRILSEESLRRPKKLYNHLSFNNLNGHGLDPSWERQMQVLSQKKKKQKLALQMPHKQ